MTSDELLRIRLTKPWQQVVPALTDPSDHPAASLPVKARFSPKIAPNGKMPPSPSPPSIRILVAVGLDLHNLHNRAGKAENAHSYLLVNMHYLYTVSSVHELECFIAMLFRLFYTYIRWGK